jgi:hypothetical protein
VRLVGHGTPVVHDTLAARDIQAVRGRLVALFQMHLPQTELNLELERLLFLDEAGATANVGKLLLEGRVGEAPGG